MAAEIVAVRRHLDLDLDTVMNMAFIAEHGAIGAHTEEMVEKIYRKHNVENLYWTKRGGKPDA